MKKLVSSVILGLLSANGLVSAAQGESRLVVGIMVDQLRTDYLEQLKPLFGNKGFNRLISNGVYLKDVDFRNTVSDPVSAAAVLYTGAWGAINGISAAEVYDENSNVTKGALEAAGSNSVVRKYSPENLRLSTIADELAVHGNGLSKIYSVAADPQVAVLMTGHAGNSALWIDDNTGKWTTSTYYLSQPAFASNRNRTSPLPDRISAAVWRPSLPPGRYPIMPLPSASSDFNYTFKTGRDAIIRFKNSPLGNEEVTDMAIEVLKSSKLSDGSVPVEMLNIAYSAAPVDYDPDGDSRLELLDTYVRLDADLARLFDEIDRTVGLSNATVVLMSSGYAVEPQLDGANAKLPVGDISLKKAESLLNSYLSATYGNADYVAAIVDGSIYLNHKVIADKRLNLSDIRSQAREFLLKISGISEAYTLDEVLRSDRRRLENIALTVDPKASADIFLFYTPGWTLEDDNVYPPKRKEIREGNPSTPVFIMGPSIAPAVIGDRVEATAIAPTVASSLHIRAPNGAAEKPLLLPQNR